MIKSKARRAAAFILCVFMLVSLASCAGDNVKSPEGAPGVRGLYHPFPVFFETESGLSGVSDGTVSEYKKENVSFTVNHSGIDYDITLTKFTGDKGSICTGTFEGDDEDTHAENFEATWSADPIDYEATVIYLDVPLRHRYPLVYNNETGEISDILENMHTAILYINNIIFSPDRTKLLLFCDEATEIYYCDLETGEMTFIEDLTGIKNANGAMWIDDTTIALMRTSTADPFSPEVEVFMYDIAANTHEITLQQSSKYHEESGRFMGVILFDGHYGVIAYSGGGTASIDFKTGRIYPIEGFSFENDGDIAQTTYENGTHLLCRHTNSLRKTQYVAIIDLTTGKEVRSCTIPSKYKTVMYVDETHFAACEGSAEFEQEYVIFSFD